MIKNYLKTAWRNLKGNKFYSLINISGLAVGLATGIMLLLWVQSEQSYDRFHRHYKQIYKLSTHFSANGEAITWQWVPGPLAVISKSIPQVESIARINSQSDQVLSNVSRTKIFDGNEVAFVDSTFFSMFDFVLEKGNVAGLFPNNNSVVLTQTTAEKLFGSADAAMGQVLAFRKDNFTVSGIVEDFPENSSLRYDAIFPMGFYAQQFTANGGNGDWKTIDEDMGNFGFETFVKLQVNAMPEKIGEAFSSLFFQAKKGGDAEFRLQSLESLHLVSADGNDANLKMVRLFMLVAVLLLLIAGINYINLSTARSLIRAKEVSIRKIVGANKGQLFFQFISETFLLFCIATILAIGFIYLSMPLYNSISGKQLSFSLNSSIWKVIALAMVGTMLTASIYPALLLSSFSPIQALKGKIHSTVGTDMFRKTLVVFQFSISIALIISTLVISKQMSYIRSKNIGYDKNYVFTVPLPDRVAEHIDAVRNELSKESGILNVSLSDVYNISDINSSTGDIHWSGKPENNQMIISQSVIDKDFIPTMKMQFLEGENFSGTPAGSAHYILNETAVTKMGLKAPYVGQEISFHERKGTIIGVIKDFNFQSLKKEISPLLFFTWWKGNILHVRTTAADAQQAIATVEKQYKKYAGDVPFAYNFVDKQFETLYEADQRAGVLFNLFAGIAIFISCLGLFALATYTARVRRKEIGVRKVLGATVGSIMRMLSNDFVKLLVVAFLIASPIAWWGMNNWLDDFAYRISIQWWMFVLAGALAIVIALATVSFQAVRAAIANPVDSLRDE